MFRNRMVSHFRWTHPNPQGAKDYEVQDFRSSIISAENENTKRIRNGGIRNGDRLLFTKNYVGLCEHEGRWATL